MHINVSAKWIPRNLLTEVDALSRRIDYDDWETTPSFFDFVQQTWGTFTVDCFADSLNAKTSRFYSKYLCPRTSGVNAFLYPWAEGLHYLAPPVYLAGKTIKHLAYYKGTGVLIVPYWVSATFWIYLRKSNDKFHSFVKVGHGISQNF